MAKDVHPSRPILKQVDLSQTSNLRVALVHDWLTGLRGGERCLLNFLKLYPEADIFTLLHVPGSTSPDIDKRVKQSSFLQSIPGARRLYRHFLPLFPFAIRTLDLRGYDLVVSLSHAAAKNVRTDSQAVHVCYCFTPMRYIWDQVRSYFGSKSYVLWPLVLLLRQWDIAGSKEVTQFVSISHFVSSRIRKFYARDSVVIFPPVDTSWITPAKPQEPGEAFLYAGALVPYKRVDVVVDAFNELGLPLWIVGSGPEEGQLKMKARSNIHFLGKLTDAELAERYRRCRALLFPGKEDFGMIPVECLAAGRPVIGTYEGALRESLIGAKPWRDPDPSRLHGLCGVFMNPRERSKKQALMESVRYFIEHESTFQVKSCINRAQEFSVARFEQCWRILISTVSNAEASVGGRVMLNLRTHKVFGLFRFRGASGISDWSGGKRDTQKVAY